jgi:hypothetical protein
MFSLTGLMWGIHAVIPHFVALAIGFALDLSRRRTFLLESNLFTTSGSTQQQGPSVHGGMQNKKTD